MEETSGMTAVPAYQKDTLDEKIVAAFPGKIVRKDLTAQMKQGFGVPTFVLEYLLGMYCATDDEVAAAEGLERIRKILTENFVRPDESEAVKSRIRERGRHTVIDRLSAVLDEREDIYVGTLAILKIDPFVVPDRCVREYTKMLTGGIWCILGIEYVHGLSDGSPRKGGKRSPQDSPFQIVSITPIQMPNLDLDELISHRDAFTDEEWEALVLRSAGYEPSGLTPRERMHFLERMVPLVERNYNLCELGPRGTGKSHLYTEVSPHAYLLSGGQTTTAKLFADLRGVGGAALGLVGYWDCIAFDEVAGMRFKATDAINIMKGYMANGSFGRGTSSYTAEASMVFEGNINESPAAVLKTTHLFDPFPPEMGTDTAFLDRLGGSQDAERPSHRPLCAHHGLPLRVLSRHAPARLHAPLRRVVPSQRRLQRARRDRRAQDLLGPGQAHVPHGQAGQEASSRAARVRDRGTPARQGAAQDHGRRGVQRR